MRCPKCQSETLIEFTVDKIAVDRCSQCNGTWFDDHELSQLLADEANQVARLLKGKAVAEAAGRKGHCPRDGSSLLRIYSAIDRAVIVDACADCHGIWLDGGEFEKLYAAQNLR
jgi:Zn-finger nucleic acid-binding protein